MAKTTVQVVLKDDVDNLGRCGELVRVKPGFARNYLLRRGRAALASRGNVAQIEHETALARKRAAKLHQTAQEHASALEAVSVEITAQAGDNGKLFGSVGTKEIAAALVAQGIEIDRKTIHLAVPIKALGAHEAKVKLGYEISASISVTVVAAP